MLGVAPGGAGYGGGIDTAGISVVRPDLWSITSK